MEMANVEIPNKFENKIPFCLHASTKDSKQYFKIY